MAKRQMISSTGLPVYSYSPEDLARRELEFTIKILKTYRDTFIEDVDARSICDDLRHHNVIPDSLAKKVNESDDRQAATMLYNHVVKQGSKESVAKLYKVMIAEKGYPRMNELGENIKESLQSYNLTSDTSMNPSGHSMALQPMINLLSMHEGMQRQEPLPELPLTPYSALPPSTSFSMSHLSLPQGASCQHFPSVPKYFPLEEKLKDKFGKLVGALAEAVRNTSPNKFSALKRILCQHLRPLRTSPPPELPDDSEELLKYLDDKWDFLNIRLVQVIVESLPKRVLKDKLESYERYLSRKLKEFLFKCQKEGIKPKQRPFGCYVMVEVQASPEEIMLGDILKLRDFLEDSLHIRPVYFDGLEDGSIVVFLSIPDECVYTLGTLLPSYIPVLQSWKISCVVAQGYFALDVQECIFTPICKAEWSNQLVSLKDQLHAEWDRFEEHMAACEGSDVDKDQQLLDSMKMKFRLKEEELKAATDEHHKAVRSCLEMEKRATSAEGERDGVLAKLREVQIEKNESGEKYISVCKEKDEIEADLKKMLVDNNNLSVVLNHCKQMLLDKGFEIDEVEAISQELEESDATFKEIVSKRFSPVHEKATSMQPKTEDKSVWRYDDIDKETLIQKDNEVKVQNKEFEEEYRSSKDSLGASMQTKEELQSTVSSLQEKLEQAEKSTLKESREKASMLKELRQRIHDLESSFEKERSGAAAKVAILENMLHGMKQRVSRDHGLWWKVKQEVTRSLGKQWSLLAQACNINREDIKEIMNLYPDDLPEQISQMFYLIEERKDYSTVCSLMMCLRKAAMNSNHANQLHFRNLAESVFVIAVTYVCDGSFHIRWETFAKSVGAPSDMIEECLLDGTSSKKAQSVTFLQRWCQKNEWESLQRLVLGFEKMGDFNAANCAAWDMFGMSLADFKIVIQPHPVASGIQARFPIGNVVKFQSSGVHYRGTLKWAGFLPGVSSEMAGIELDSICYTLEGQTCNGTYHGQPYFTCDDGMGVFIPLEDVEYDWSLTTTGKVMEKLFTMPLKDQPPSVAMMEGWTWDEHRYPATTVNHMAQNIKQIESHTDTCIRIHGCLGTSDVLVEIYGTQKQKRNAASMISSLISSLGLQRLQPKHSGTFWPTAQQLMPHIYYMAIQAIRRNIGDKWPDLARGLGFDETDIDAIRVGPDRDNLHGQIFKMIRQWEQGQERGRGSVYGLLQGLRVAVSNTRAPNLKEIRDRIFTDILKVYILKDPDICGCWHKIAGVVGFSSDVKRECTLTDPTDRRKQAEEFLRRWCARDGWKVVDNLPMTLEKAGFEKAAAKVQDGVFGSVATGSPEIQQEPTLGIDNTLEVGDAVVVTLSGIKFYGTLKWIGSLPGQDNMAGMEMEEKYELLRDSQTLCDGKKDGVQYFTCDGDLGAFFSLDFVSKDDRFSSPDSGGVGQQSLALASLNLRDDPPKLLLERSTSVPDPSTSTTPFTLPPNPSTLRSYIHTLHNPVQETSPQSIATSLVQPPQETSPPSLSRLLSQPQQETSPPSINLRGTLAEIDSPYWRTKSTSDTHNLPPQPMQQASSTAFGSTPRHAGYSGDSPSKRSDEHSKQPLYESGDQRIYCLRFAGDVVGLLIGKGGANIRMVQEETNAKVQVLKSKESSISEDAKVVVAGTEEQCLKAIRSMIETVQQKRQRLHSYTETLELSDAEAGRVIGLDGVTLQSIETFSGAKLIIDRRPSGFEGMFRLGTRTCKIHGSPEEVASAKSLIERVQRGDDLSGLRMVYFLGQLLQRMPSGMSVVDRVDDEDQDQLARLLSLL